MSIIGFVIPELADMIKLLQMDKTYNPQTTESEIYSLWEGGGYFTPRVRSGQAPKKKPFSIVLPLPNANDPMHMGHALFTVQDIMCRYHRMLGGYKARPCEANYLMFNFFINCLMY